MHQAVPIRTGSDRRWIHGLPYKIWRFWGFMNQEPVFKNFCAPRAINVCRGTPFSGGKVWWRELSGEISGGICRGHNPRRHQGRSQPGLRDSYNRVHSRLGADTCVAELPAPSSAKVSTRERRTMRAPDGARSPEPKPERRMTRPRARRSGRVRAARPVTLRGLRRAFLRLGTATKMPPRPRNGSPTLKRV